MLVIQRPTVEAVEDAVGNIQRFAISPLEPGFGHTLGNSLRRTLLSSIPGTAVTEVRFDDALHEFDTIAGVTEDVTDIILNLKDIVLSSELTEARTVRLDVAGPKDVTASDIQFVDGIEVLNPDQHIATVNGKGRLAMDLTIDRGKGYASANTQSDAAIGSIPVDAIFAPVRRVSFQVEPTRVEQSTEYDRLVITVETDGSIEPRDAMASAGATLRSLVELVETMTEEPEGLTLSEAVPTAVASPDLERSVEELDLSERPRNCLKRAQVDTVGQLLEKTEDDLLAITNFGQKSLDEVLEKLDALGLSLRSND